ncbi:MAG TPA: MFS transporter, partial [Novosphingobium sp.]|nr:MFS transporter [Novosphingobium sp.]
MAAPARAASPLPNSLMVFAGFLAISLLLPACAFDVAHRLGRGETMAGAVAGLQSLATLLSRPWAGGQCDRLGAHVAVIRGFPLLLLGCGAAFLAGHLAGGPALALLALGRVPTGLGESLILTGGMSWGMARTGPAGSGKVIAWQGLAMFGAMVLGAPLGLWLVQSGIGPVALAAGLAAGLGLGLALLVPGEAPVPGTPLNLREVVRLIGAHGPVLALAGTPYALINAFLGLWFVAMGWAGKEWALALFGIAFVIVRLVGAGWPSRYGAV